MLSVQRLVDLPLKIRHRLNPDGSKLTGRLYFLCPEDLQRAAQGAQPRRSVGPLYPQKNYDLSIAECVGTVNLIDPALRVVANRDPTHSTDQYRKVGL
jgi:hypothetical protein